MTKEEKALNLSRKYGTPKNKNREIAVYQSCIEMADWKDEQLKEYLEKKREEYISRRDNENMWTEQWAVFHALACSVHQIINELFKEE